MFMESIVVVPSAEEIPNIVSPVECNVAQASPCDKWYLDLGCSNHMTGNIELFFSLDDSVQTKVTLGTNIQVTFLGKGDINCLTKQEEKTGFEEQYDEKRTIVTERILILHGGQSLCDYG